MSWPPSAKRDLITGAVVTVVGIVYYAATFAIKRTDNIVTPATFPAIVGIVLILLGLILVAQAVVAAKKQAAAVELVDSLPPVAGGGDTTASARGDTTIPTSETTPAGEAASAQESGEPDRDVEAATGTVIEAEPEPKWRKVVLQFVIFFAYLAIMIPVGFLLSTTAFLMGVTSLYSPQKWIRNLIFSIVFSGVIYFAFVYLLAVYLPAGILG